MAITFSALSIGTDTYRKAWQITRGADPAAGEAATAVAHGLPGVPTVHILPITNAAGAVNLFQLSALPSATHFTIIGISVVCGVTMCAAVTALVLAEYHSIVQG